MSDTSCANIMPIMPILYDHSFVTTVQATLCLLLTSLLQVFWLIIFSSQLVKIFILNFSRLLKMGIRREIFNGCMGIDFFKKGAMNRGFLSFLLLLFLFFFFFLFSSYFLFICFLKGLIYFLQRRGQSL